MINDDIRLGRVAGIPLAMNWSVLVIVLLLTWSLAVNVLPHVADGYTTAAYWTAALATAFIFFVSLLAHELSHAIMARRAGMEVEGMTLWLFGGVAKLGGQPPNAHADLRIAAVGPAVSIALSAGFSFLAIVLGGLGAPDLAVAMVAWLAAINLILALFNLIPGAPLDGGRVLRALLWRRHGSWVKAAVSASRAGQVLGYVLIWLGLVQFVLLTSIGGLWMVFIGWFILAASRAEREYILAESALTGLKVRDLMTPDPQTAPGSLTVADLIDQYLLSRPHSAYPVEGPDGRIHGLVTLHQLRGVSPAERSHTLVADVALAPQEVPITEPDRPVVGLLEQMEDRSAGGRFLVFEDNHLVGMVTPSDISRAISIRSMDGPPPDTTTTPTG